MHHLFFSSLSSSLATLYFCSYNNYTPKNSSYVLLFYSYIPTLATNSSTSFSPFPIHLQSWYIMNSSSWVTTTPLLENLASTSQGMCWLDYILKNLFLHDNLASLLPHLFQPLMISTTPNSTLPHHHHSSLPPSFVFHALRGKKRLNNNS